jgi:hypothetical protein
VAVSVNLTRPQYTLPVASLSTRITCRGVSIRAIMSLPLRDLRLRKLLKKDWLSSYEDLEQASNQLNQPQDLWETRPHQDHLKITLH